MRPRDILTLIGKAAAGWSDDNALRLSAALAYYAIFSLAPLLVIMISVSGLIFGQATARDHIVGQMRDLAGSRAADAIQALLQATSHKSASVSATAIGLAVLLFGASGVFSELKDALNTIWGVTIRPGSRWRTLVRERFISFNMVLVVGFLLLVSLLLSAALAAFGASLRAIFPVSAHLWQLIDFVFSFAIVTVLFAMIFKILPNVQLRWRDVWSGASGTAFLFTIGKILIGFYLGTSGVASYYGAAGSAIVILLWVYYSSCILFFGAELTKAYVLLHGGGVVPDDRAVLRSSLSGDKSN